MKKHSKALVFFAVSKQIPIVYSADRGRAEIMHLFFKFLLIIILITGLVLYVDSKRHI